MYEIFEQLLQKHNVKAYQVAKATGITNSTFTDWKNGRSSPKIDKLQKIADYFGVSVDYLMGNEPTEPEQTEVTDNDIKFAFWGGGADEVTDEMLEDVRNYAQFLMERERKKNESDKK